ncbi:MAG: GNAT family N-acetyltransferase [Polyangiales bacterium]
MTSPADKTQGARAVSAEDPGTVFPAPQLVQRIEAAERDGLAAIVASCGGAWATSLAGGAALYRGTGSPFNKLVGLGFAPLTAAALDGVEQRYAALGAPVQVELATYADPAITNLLITRGYQLTGYENVLGRSLSGTLPPSAAEIEVRLARDDERAAWVDVLTEGFAARVEGEAAAAHDDFDRAALEGVFRDMSDKPTVAHWLAFIAGHTHVGGGASMGVSDGIAQLFGAATRPSARRRGVQSALLAARLRSAQQQGCDLAVITTQPGSKSQHNAQRAGFSLLYARAIWLREPVGASDQR